MVSSNRNKSEDQNVRSPSNADARTNAANGSSDAAQSSNDLPIYLRHRSQGELGQLLRAYYDDVLDQPLPDHLLQLIDQFRQKDQDG